jgi:hypothetical protein
MALATPTSVLRGIASLSTLLALLLMGTPGRSHDLAVDQLVLRLQGGQLRGELTLNPEHTRALGDVASERHKAQVVALARRTLRLKVDGQPLAMDLSVRELWQATGATNGDLLLVSAALPRGSQHLVVSSGPELDPLVVTFTRATARSRAEAYSTLLTAEGESPPYFLSSDKVAPGWAPGGPELFDNAVALHRPPSDTPPFVDDVWPQARRFVVLGFRHIVPDGLDHIAFVVLLVLRSLAHWKQIVLALSAFTLGHTVALALACLNLIRLPAVVIEPVIALSICAVGVSILLSHPKVRQALSRPLPSNDASPRAALGVVLLFGLVHGLGFAGALSDLEFSGRSFWVALLSFNVGVELGQLAVVGALLSLVWSLTRRWLSAAQLHNCVIVPTSAAITLAGLFWVFERLAAP